MGYFKKPKESTIKLGTSNKDVTLEELRRTAPLRTDTRAVLIADAVASLGAGIDAKVFGHYMIGVTIPESFGIHSTMMLHSPQKLPDAIYMLTEMVLELAKGDAHKAERILNEMKASAALMLAIREMEFKG